MAPDRRFRAFCLTWFKGHNEWVDMYRILDTVTCEYMVYQTEKCPDTGNTHIQGYVEFKNGKTVDRVRTMFPGASVRKTDGTGAKNTAYCTKVASRIANKPAKTRGTMSAQGTRNDIRDMQADIKEGLSDVEMFEKYPTGWAQYHRVLQEYRMNLIKPRSTWTKSLTFWGATGLGKSTRAFYEAKKIGTWATFLIPQGRSSIVWADGTVGADVVIIEDYEGEISYGMIKKMLDRHPMTMHVKHSMCQWTPKLVIFTSNTDPKTWYGDHKWAEGPLERRMTTQGSKIIHFTKEWTVPEQIMPDAMKSYFEEEIVVKKRPPVLVRTDATVLDAMVTWEHDAQNPDESLPDTPLPMIGTAGDWIGGASIVVDSSDDEEVVCEARWNPTDMFK